jgi:UDPglucose 6-dehydrogenase
MNQLANFCEKVGADVDLVRRGIASDNRIGKRFLFSGIGYGGSCFPKDVNALIKTSLEYKSEMSILTEVNKVNDAQKTVLVDKILDYYDGNLKGKHFAVWGLAFKPNTDDIREAPALTIIDELTAVGASICAFDPEAMPNVKSQIGDKIAYADNQYDVLENADALVIATEWSEFRTPDFKKMKSLLKENVIFDGRNLFDLARMQEWGFHYVSIGRRPVLKQSQEAYIKA